MLQTLPNFYATPLVLILINPISRSVAKCPSDQNLQSMLDIGQVANPGQPTPVDIPFVYQIRGKSSNLCLVVSMDDKKSPLVIDNCEEKTVGAWFMVVLKDGSVRLVNMETCEALLQDDDSNLGLIPRVRNNHNAEWWTPKLGNRGSSEFENIKTLVSNKCVDVSGGANVSGLSVILWDCNKQGNQKWKLEEIKKMRICHYKAFARAWIHCPLTILRTLN